MRTGSGKYRMCLGCHICNKLKTTKYSNKIYTRKVKERCKKTVPKLYQYCS